MKFIKKLVTLFTLFILIFTSEPFANNTSTGNKIINVEYNSQYKYNTFKTSKITDDFVFDNAQKFYFSPTRYNMGNVFMNTKYNLYPNLINKSDTTIEIPSIRGTCTCTSVLKSRGTLKAKDKLSVGAIYNTTGFPKNKKIRKSVFVFSDGIPNRGKLRFFYENVIGFNGATLIPQKEEIKFKGKQEKVFFEIKNRSNKTVKNVKYYSFKDYISVNHLSSLKPGINRIEISRKKVIDKDFKTTLTIYGDGDSLCVFSVPVILRK